MEKTAKNGLVKLKYPMVIIPKKKAMIFFASLSYYPTIIYITLSQYYPIKWGMPRP